MSTFVQYLKDTRAEMRHVSWPSRSSVISATALVVAIAIGVGIFLAALDLFFGISLTKYLASR